MTQLLEEKKSELTNWLKRTNKNLLNIFIADQVFGGRPGEAPQTPKDFKIIGETLLITFSTTEKLWVENPTNIQVKNEELTINSAKTIRWGWHYYGRTQIDLNWCEKIYIINDSKIIKTELYPLDSILKTQTTTFELNNDKPVISIREW